MIISINKPWLSVIAIFVASILTGSCKQKPIAGTFKGQATITRAGKVLKLKSSSFYEKDILDIKETSIINLKNYPVVIKTFKNSQISIDKISKVLKESEVTLIKGAATVIDSYHGKSNLMRFRTPYSIVEGPRSTSFTFQGKKIWLIIVYQGAISYVNTQTGFRGFFKKNTIVAFSDTVSEAFDFEKLQKSKKNREINLKTMPQPDDIQVLSKLEKLVLTQISSSR